jgi:hypothetical protein
VSVLRPFAIGQGWWTWFAPQAENSGVPFRVALIGEIRLLDFQK